MSDPLSEVIRLLHPRPVQGKLITGAGRWAVRYAAFGQPGFCAVLEGACRLAVDGQEPLTLEAGDFVLMPATPGFTMSGFAPAPVLHFDPQADTARTLELHHGDTQAPPDVHMYGGAFHFDSPDAQMLVSLLPALLHLRGVPKLGVLVQLVRDEFTEQQPGHEHALSRLMELLLIEALRATSHQGTPAGLLRGLADPRLAASMRLMHQHPAHPWSVPDLAREAALSRSAFFERFHQALGLPPMEYLLRWRMALAKDWLRQGNLPIAEVARRVGYASASTFSTAFARHVGQAPGRFGRQRALA